MQINLLHPLGLFGLLLLLTTSLTGQATATATASSGGAYAVFQAAGFGVEGPDDGGSIGDDNDSNCTPGVPGDHSSFGEHITQAFDTELNQNVFSFFSHVDEDSDRCINFDRVRIEIKGGPAGQSNPELEHTFGEESFYRWQFKLDENFVGAGSFNHLFQLKAQGTSDDADPILTLTARTSRVELLHDISSGGDGVPDPGTTQLVQAPLTDFRGQWVEVYLRIQHTDAGELEFTVRNVATGSTIMSYSGSGLDLYRDSPNNINSSVNTTEINRPKWGIYRSTPAGNTLRDEEIRFANFCSSESAATFCPSLIDNPTDGTPTAVTGALPLDGAINVPDYMPLVWDASEEATSYNVYFGTAPTPPLVASGSSATQYAPELSAGTTYYFQIGAVNASGETKNTVQQFTTLTDTDDGVWEVARGHARFDLESPQFFDFSTNNVGASTSVVGTVADEPGNSQYTFYSDEGSTGNYRWRYRPAADEEITLVMRLAPIAGVENISFVDFRSLGFRQKLNIKRSTVRFEQAPGSSSDQTVDFNGFWDDEAYHVLRVTFTATISELVTTLYLDENPVAFAQFSSTVAQGSSYLDIGRAGGDDIGAMVDFIAINPTGGFAPDGSGTATPPADLFDRGSVPEAVTNTAPLDGATNVPTSVGLKWDGSVGATSYNVYLGTASGPRLVATTSDTVYFFDEYRAATAYYYLIGAVNAIGETLSEEKTFTILTDTDDGEWDVFRGHVRPDIESPGLFSFDTDFPNTPASIPNGPQAVAGDAGNAEYTSFSDQGSTGNNRWRYDAFGSDAEVTMVARLKPISGNNNITYIEFRGLGFRQKLNLKQSSLKFESAVGDPEVDFAGFWDDSLYHTLRLTYNLQDGDLITTVYLDESTTPFASFASGTPTGSSYLEFGRAGGDDFGATIDYIAFSPEGAYAPQQSNGPALPEDLVEPEPEVTILSPLQVRLLGKGSSQLRWSTDNQLGVAFYTVESRVLGAAFSALATTDTKGNTARSRKFVYNDKRQLSGTTYYRIKQTNTDDSFRYGNIVVVTPEGVVTRSAGAYPSARQPVLGTDEYSAPTLSPNPATTELRLGGLDEAQLTYRIFSMTGAVVGQGTLGEGQHKVDVARLPTGTYVLRCVSSEGTVTSQRFIKQ